tara:strand:- start:275 stop:2122 length:1848 start_codon:yes stop_codon:yes gene_type:complete
MCGFYFSTSDPINYSNSNHIQKFNKIKHRGVDHSKYLEIKKDKNFFLGHHRLSINDPHPRSHQPFQSSCNNYHLLFNGEIYNFRELRKNLNCDFTTDSDTEVILAGYIQEGFSFFKKLEGFFSILILDMKLNKIFLNVDPTSVKSLYYQLFNTTFEVSSEISCLQPELSKSNLSQAIDSLGLQSYYQFGYIHAPRTIYKNISKLEPGELIEFDLFKNQIKHKKKFNNHFAKLTNEKFDSLLLKAHESRLIADVPIAHFLSSGVDSTVSNTIYSKLISKKKIDVYTLAISDSELDESDQAISQTKSLNLNHDIVTMNSSQLLDEFKNFSYYIDEPFGDSSAILVSFLSKNVSQKFKVAISSDGGDELLFGYKRHYFFQIFFWVVYLPSIIKTNISKFIRSNIILKVSSLLKIKHYEIKINKLLSLLEANSLQEAYFNLLKINSDDSSQKIFKIWKSSKKELTTEKKFNLNKIIKEIDYQYYLPSINYKNDRCGMQFSLEIREPLLNYDLVRNYFDHKISFKNIIKPKYLFKKFLKKHKISVHSSKHGFSFSQKKLLNNKNNELLTYLSQNLELLQDFFDIDQIKNMMSEFKNSQKYVTELYLLVHLTLWMSLKIKK